MANTRVAGEFAEVSQLAKYPFEPYWPDAKLKICITGAGGFIASHLARRLKSEGHHIIACDWKRNEHMPVLHPPRHKRCRNLLLQFASKVVGSLTSVTVA